MLASLVSKRERLQDELRVIEKQVIPSLVVAHNMLPKTEMTTFESYCFKIKVEQLH